MRRLSSVIATVFVSMSLASAQNFAYVDTEYILGSIPEYKTAQTTISDLSEQWQEEVNKSYTAIETAYNDYQSKRSSMSAEAQRSQEDAIISKENAAKELQKKYFGSDGLLSQKQEELLQPTLDKVSAAIKTFATENNYDIIFDTSSDASVLYSNPKNNKSDQILVLLGVK